MAVEIAEAQAQRKGFDRNAAWTHAHGGWHLKHPPVAGREQRPPVVVARQAGDQHYHPRLVVRPARDGSLDISILTDDLLGAMGLP